MEIWREGRGAGNWSDVTIGKINALGFRRTFRKKLIPSTDFRGKTSVGKKLLFAGVVSTFVCKLE